MVALDPMIEPISDDCFIKGIRPVQWRQFVSGSRRGIVSGMAAGVALLVLVGCDVAGPGQDETLGRQGITVTAGEDGIKPSFLLVLIDALRQDHLGVYGYQRPTSPFLDEIATSGVYFTNACAQAPQTYLSTASMFTSRFFPLRVSRGNLEFREIPGLKQIKQDRFRDEVPYLADENVTLAEIMRQGGYRTSGLFTNPHHHPTSGFWQGFDEPIFVPLNRKSEYARGENVRDRFIEWFAQVPVSEPFFAYVHLMDVHNPYQPPEEIAQHFVRGAGENKYMNGVPTADRLPSTNDIEYMIDLYDAEIRYEDGIIRDMWSSIAERRDDVILIVASDHGDEFMDHGGLGHGKTLEKEMLHVPLIFFGPGIGRDQPIGEVVRNIDIAPTITELAGLQTADTFDGKSLAGLCEPYGSLEARLSYAETGGLRGLTTQEWHLIVKLKEKQRVLYNNRSDPRGLNDVAETNAAIIAEFKKLEREFAQRRSLIRHEQMLLEQLYEHSGAVDKVDPKVIEQLEALGYLQ